MIFTIILFIIMVQFGAWAVYRGSPNQKALSFIVVMSTLCSAFGLYYLALIGFIPLFYIWREVK